MARRTMSENGIVARRSPRSVDDTVARITALGNPRAGTPVMLAAPLAAVEALAVAGKGR